MTNATKMNDKMSDSYSDRLADARELYERERAKAWDKLREEAHDKNRQAVRERGSIGGTAMWASIGNVMTQLQQQVEKAAEIRTEICRDVPELCGDGEIEAWRREMNNMLNSWEGRTIAYSIGRVLGVQREPEVQEMLRHPDWQARVTSIRAIIEREAGIMTRRRRLGTGASTRAGDVYIQNSTVGAVNLGVVAGDLTSTITTLRTQGSTDLATALEQLRESVNGAEDLGDRRGDVLQALAAIAREAEQPADHRKPAVVRVLLDYVGPILTATAGAMDAWHRAYPVVAAAFGLPH